MSNTTILIIIFCGSFTLTYVFIMSLYNFVKEKKHAKNNRVM